MTTVHYLLPSGERLAESVSHVRVGDSHVEWFATDRDVTIKIPWSRILMIEDEGVTVVSSRASSLKFDFAEGKSD